jgi:ADP-ribose pyrophosphatase YjhB (NUDIX family)
MPNFYHDQQKILVSVDCIILGFKQNKLNVLIFKRKFEPLKGEKSLMGGFVKPGESIDETANRVLLEYTGITDVFMEQVGTYGNVERDTGERVISIVYYALINMESYDERLEKVHNAQWIDINEVGKLVFDHNQMLTDTIKILRRRAAIRPIGFNLLPEKFTLPQLQSLYEAIYQTSLDKRNFRKKIFEMDILEKLDEKDKNASKRGAYYYRFNKEKYDRRLEDGAAISFI